MQNLTQPTLLLKPFAESGDKNTIPSTNTDVSNPQLADLTNGFPAITGQRPENGGLPPERKDFNGLGYLTTTYDFFYQAGGTFTFNSTISTAIGGYPQGARLWYTDNNGATTVLRSTKNNNTDNFVTTPSYIGTSWVAEIPALGWNNAWTGSNTFSGNLTSSGTNSFSGSNTFSGSVTFSSSVELGGTISGSNSVKETINGWYMPDYSAGVDINDGYEAVSNGWLRIVIGGNNRTAVIKIDDVEVYNSSYGATYGTPDNEMVPIAKGSTVSKTGSFTSIFYPCIGG